MADFCWDCTEREFDVPGSCNEFYGLTTDPRRPVHVLCEGCGWIDVDHYGKRTSGQEPNRGARVADDPVIGNIEFALRASPREVGPACVNVTVPGTIATDDAFREAYEQGYRHALSDVRLWLASGPGSGGDA